MPVPSGSDPSSLYGAELVTVPYVTPATFKAYPSYAEVDNLVVAAAANAQLAQLNDILVMASQWASDAVNMPLHAHIAVDNTVLRVRRNGSLSWHPPHNPIRLVTALSYAWDLSGSSQSVSDLSGQWIENGSQVDIAFPAMSTNLNGLQFGPPAGSSPLYTSWTYQAGYTNAVLAQASNAGATSIVVSDPTGLLPGDRLRIWEPGVEEACTVAASYGVGSTTVPLNSALTYAHTVGAGVSAMPSSIMLAVVLYTTALLMRPDSVAEDAFPDTRSGITTRSEDARRDGTGLINEAYRQLRSFARVR